MNRLPGSNSLDRTQQLLDAEKPVPPKDFKRRWGAREMNLFNQYLEGRAYADWGQPELRLLGQAVDLEITLQDAYADMESSGPIVTSTDGKRGPHPAIAIITKITTAQGSLLRRLGIVIDGTTAPRDVRKNAAASKKLHQNQNQEQPKNAAANLLAH